MMSWDGRSCKVVPESLVGAHPFGSWLSSCDSLLVLIWVRAIVLLLSSMVGFHRQEVMEKETLTKASEGGSLFTSQPNKCMCILRSHLKKKKKKRNPVLISQCLSFSHILSDQTEEIKRTQL